MTLRVVGYERNAHGSPLPDILVEGETAGPPAHVPLSRKVRGRVSAIGDGAVRWSIVSACRYWFDVSLSSDDNDCVL